MKSFQSRTLLEMLEADIRQLILEAEQLKTENPELLEKQPAPGKWSVAQVLEHLISYGRYYLPAIEKSLLSGKPAKDKFKPGWLGDYFTRLMKPDQVGKIGHRMNAPRNHRPAPEAPIKPAIDNFLEQQQKLSALLEQAKQKDIGSIRTPVSISPYIRLKVGDTFRFFIAHEQRHFLQIRNVLAALQQPKDKFQAGRLAVQP